MHTCSTTSTTPSLLLHLPDHVVLHILQYLDHRQFLSTTSLCSDLRRFAKNDCYWAVRCARDYAVDASQLWSGWSYYTMYSRLLHRYPDLIRQRYWLLHTTDLPFGGLFASVLTHRSLVLYRLLPPVDDIRYHLLEVGQDPQQNAFLPAEAYSDVHRLRYLPIVSIERSPDNDEDVRAFCLLSSDSYIPETTLSTHALPRTFAGGEFSTVDISTSVLPPDDDGQTRIVLQIPCRRRNEDKPVQEILRDLQIHNVEYWISIEHGLALALDDPQNYIETYGRIGYAERLRKFRTWNTNAITLHSYRLPTISNDGQLARLPASGIYVGAYGFHGWEIVEVTYTSNMEMRVIKLTGDGNVPAGQRTLTFDISKSPLKLEKDDFESRETLLAALDNIRDSAEPPADESMPFHVPRDFEDRTPRGLELPMRASRYQLGFGRVAFENFANPEWIDAVLVVFKHEHPFFGVMWPFLGSFAMFYRVLNVNEQ